MHWKFALRTTLFFGVVSRGIIADKPSTIEVRETVTSISGCPFNISASFNADLTVLEIAYSRNDLSTEVEGSYTCFGWTRFAHTGQDVEMLLPSAKVQGKLAIPEGTSLRVETTLSWFNDQRPQNFSTARLEGPSEAISKGIENTEVHPSVCRTGKWRDLSDGLSIKSEVFVKKNGNSSSNPAPVAVSNIVYSFDIVWKNGCSLPSPGCFFDRTGWGYCPRGS
ncbi:uncharacterized protein EI97DRAFT_502921 [Westerdykella ornata]|uniref:Uncharacterized protein n=1 Tax=Westerdykella ornata TaxID=318751 RepID=A0A6A6JCL0_WESOR|nr:uncharacterized protein EI97DRAFT_502921 [Westerdykella ornata]KAF2274015.1 hypothetical protein EI97DRAFT_502921 [Westerdykella ornata]